MSLGRLGELGDPVRELRPGPWCLRLLPELQQRTHEQGHGRGVLPEQGAPREPTLSGNEPQPHPEDQFSAVATSKRTNAKHHHLVSAIPPACATPNWCNVQAKAAAFNRGGLEPTDIRRDVVAPAAADGRAAAQVGVAELPEGLQPERHAPGAAPALPVAGGG